MCGVFGIRSEERDVARLAYFGLFALQHRGQESAGIVVVDREGNARAHRGMGLVSEDFHDTELVVNAVLRWEYSPGSTLFLVWTQNRSDSESIGTFRTGRALDRLWRAAGDNIFLVKLSYWWNP